MQVGTISYQIFVYNLHARGATSFKDLRNLDGNVAEIF